MMDNSAQSLESAAIPDLDNLTLDDIIQADQPEDSEQQQKEEDKQDQDQTQDQADDQDQQDDQQQVDQQEDQTQDKEEDKTEDEEPPPLVDEIQELLGFDLGEDKEFEDSPQGVVELVKESANHLASTQFNEVLDNFPHLREYYEFLRAGGDPNRFVETRFPETDYSIVELTDSDTALQERVLSIKLKQDGHDAQTVESAVQRAKDVGILSDEAKLALTFLQKQQKEDQDTILERQQAEQVAKREQVEEYWTGVEELLDKENQFSGVTIPEAEKKEFFEYISKPVTEQGHSQLLLDQYNLTPEEQLMNMYIIKNRKRLGELINRRARSQNKESLRDRLANSQSQSRLRGIQEDMSNVDVADIDWDKQNLLG